MTRAMYTLTLLELLVATAAVSAPPPDMPAPKFPACVCGSACACKPGVCPAQCPVAKADADAHTVYVEARPDGDVMEWSQKGPAGEVTWVWTVAKGGKATPELAAALVKSKLCEQGRCPLLPVKVRLVAKKKFD